jgi:hypothetical protein
MKVSVEGKKVVVWDGTGPYVRQNLCFDRNVVKEKWYNYSAQYLYEECLKRDIQIITPDIYFALPDPKPKAISVREHNDANLEVTLALERSGVKSVLVRSSENPFYACRFYWNLTRITSHFDYAEVMEGVRAWVFPKSHFRPAYNPHAYYTHVREVRSDFHKKKFLVLIQSNVRVHWLRRLYVYVMNFIKPMPNFVNREGYKSRLDAIRYFSGFPGFDLYGRGWDKPVRYARKYDEAVRKSWRGAPDDKFETMRQYKFSVNFENSYLGGYIQYMNDSLYAGSVPIYWGAPDIADIFPENCFIDFRKFNCDFARLDKYLRNMDEETYNGYIRNINTFISSPMGGYAFSQEKYAGDVIKIFESYF